MTLKTYKYHFFLFLLILFYGITNFSVLTQDNVPFFYDEGGIYEMSRIYYHYLVENFTWDLRKIFYHYWDTSHFYPPFYMLSHLPIFFLFGKSQDVSVMTNIIFLFLLLFSIYGIGRKIKNDETGFFASLIVSTFPAVFGFSRTDFAIIALTSLVTLSIYLLLRTEDLTNKKYTILFGISVGLGILTNLIFPLYIAAPLLIYLVNVKKITKRQIENLLVSLCIGLLICSTWLAPNLISGSFFQETQSLLLSHIQYKPFAIMFSVDYLKMLWTQLYPIFSFLFIICLLFFLFLKNTQKFLFLSWLITPLIILSIIEYKEGKYILPILPAVGLIISFIIAEAVKIKKLIYYSFAIFGLLQLSILSFDVNLTDQFREEELDMRRMNGLIYAHKVDWPIKNIIDLFEDYKVIYKKNRKPAKIIAIAMGPFISHLSYRIRLPAKLGRIDDMPLNFIPVLIHPHLDLSMKINNADYIVIDEKIMKIVAQEPYVNWKIFKQYLAGLMKQFKENRNKYNLLSSYKIKDMNLSVYINKKNAELMNR
jgi:4-amino-4-deoxy-L-arabinose transferase-like glycosyltransferase